MGESYLQRKVFNRMRRFRTTSSNHHHQQANIVGSLTQTNSLESNWSQQIPSNSFSSPQLTNLIRNPLRSQDDLEENGSLNCSSSSSIGNYNISSSNNNNTENEIKSNSSKRGRGIKGVSKLKAASRAILFFRRANSSSQNQQTVMRHNRTSGAINAQHLSLSSSHTSQVASQDEQNSVVVASDKSHQQTRSNNNNNINQVPQFIVPKINALKLPLVCLIKSLDGELMREVFVHRYELGQYLIESLKVSVGINDCKYFGLKLAKSFDDQEDLRNVWLDLNESVCKQIKNKTNFIYQNSYSNSNNNSSNNSLSTSATNQQTTNQRSIDFYLRIKFYPPNLARVQDPFLRQYLWLQLRRDLRLGKLTSSMNNLTLLMACVLQYELGDFREELVEKIPELNILPNQDLIEEQAINLWSRRLIGHKKHQAQMQFLRAAVILETYGFDYYPVRDHQRQRAYLLGFNYSGIKTIRNGRIVHHFSWHSLSKISYERRMIIFHIYPTENSKRKQILGFKCLSNEDCQSLYMRLLEQKYFFTVDLAYFDKSIRRPTCLYTTPQSQSTSVDWSSSRETTDQPYATANRYTSCGPSLDVAAHNVDQLMAASNENSLEENISQNSTSSTSVNCYTCDTRRPPTAGSSVERQNNNFTTAVGDDTRTMTTRVIGAQSNDEDLNNKPTKGDKAPERISEQAGNRETSLRRTQWHRQHRQQYSSSSSSLFKLDNHDFNSHQEQEDSGHSNNEPIESTGDRKVWSKVVSCIRSCELPVPASGNGGLSVRLAEIADLMFVQPVNAIQQCNSNDNSNFLNSGPTIERSHLSLRFIMQAVRFCLFIMVMNFVIRLLDSVSSSIIDLLTISPTASGSTTSQRLSQLNEGL